MSRCECEHGLGPHRREGRVKSGRWEVPVVDGLAHRISGSNGPVRTREVEAFRMSVRALRAELACLALSNGKISRVKLPDAAKGRDQRGVALLAGPRAPKHR